MVGRKSEFEAQYLWGGGKVINSILSSNADEFYVSYNNTDIAIYGDVTTALVQGQMEHFYILNGDHRNGYRCLVEQGFDKCMEYFIDNISQINKNSEKPKNSLYGACNYTTG